MSDLLAIGVSHKTAPVELRERVTLPESRAADVLAELVASEHIHEAVALSTCNRAELYMAVSDEVEAETTALGILARQSDMRLTELVSHLYSLHNEQAVRHLFRVTSGLDAMIVGEAEIQGQVKRAYQFALGENTTSAIMNRLFRDALAAGKRVRTETGIGSNSVSVSTVAVQLARETLGDLAGKRIVVVGAGEAGEATARALVERGARSVFVANRHYDRAIGLAERCGGQAVRFDMLPSELERADIVLSSTGSPHHIVEREELDLVMSTRKGRPLLVIDIAVPRDFDPAVSDLKGVFLRDMDDLQRAVQENISGREAETGRAEALLDNELEKFTSWMRTLEVIPTITALCERGSAIARQVLDENRGRWESISKADRQRVELIATTIAKRLFHQPILQLKAGDDDLTHAYVQALQVLFRLEEEPALAAARPEEADEDEPQLGKVTDIRRLAQRRAR